MEKPLLVTINVLEDHISPSSRENRFSNDKAVWVNAEILASTTIERHMVTEGTKRIDLTVAEHGIHGTLFLPPGDGPFPGS